MFISQAYYCNHIHKEKLSSSPEIEHIKTDCAYNRQQGTQNSYISKQIAVNIWNKKSLFNAIWIVLNLVVLSSLFQIVSNTDWLFLYFIVTFIYCSLYWMLAEIVFNKLFVKISK